MKIKTIQFKPTDGKKQKNLKKIKTLFKENDFKDTDLVLLPELWSTGAKFNEFEKLSEKIPGKTTELLSKLAKQNDIYLAAGSIVENHKNELYNTLPFFNRKGELIETYRKIHLFSYTEEDKYLKPGKEIKTLKIDETKLGLTTCYDLRFPTQYRKMAINGVEVFLCPAAWPKARKHHWRILNEARAIENQAYLISCNRRGKYKENEFTGNSYIIDPIGNVVNKSDNNKFLEARINLKKPSKTRESFPTLKDYKKL